MIYSLFSVYLETAGPPVDSTSLPITSDVPPSLTNGNHAVPSSITQPPLNQSGPGRPSVTGTDWDSNDLSSIVAFKG